MKSMKQKKLAALALSAAMLFSAVPLHAFAAATPNKADYEETDKNFAKLLQYSLYFYDANMCGTDVTEQSRLAWRGNCHIYDAKVPMQPIEDLTGTNMSASFMQTNKDILDPDGDGFIDVSGGFHDAGDHVKFGMPETYAGSIVSWGYYEFRDSYEKIGEAAHTETILRHFCDYFMRSTFRKADGEVIAFCHQVGDGAEDHRYWQSPEIDAMHRPAFFVTADKPATCVVSEAAACLAINYCNFKETDPDYADKCLDYAKALYQFASDCDKAVLKSDDGPAAFYESKKWEDDYCFAGGWLYLITKDHKYLDLCLKYDDYYAPPGYVLCWNDMWNGVSIIFGRIQDEYPEICEEARVATGRGQYEKLDFWLQEAKALNFYASGSKDTPGGFFFMDEWGSVRYNAAAQFCALVYDKYKNGKDVYDETQKDYHFSDWALGQMEYLLGDNPINRCYVVGYGENSAKFPHHRAASGLTMAEDPGTHKHVLWGALVGGPRKTDQHSDTTNDWVDNEVTIDYNAAFVGASAGLYARYGDDTMKPVADFPPEEKQDDTTLFSGSDFWVSGYYMDAPESTGAGTTKLTFFVNTDALEPHTDLSIRYYFDVSEFEKNDGIPGSFVLQCPYDQVQTEVSGKKAVISEVQHYKDKIYYVEISWPDYAIANSNKKVQLILGMFYGDNFDPSNDWSLKGMKELGEEYDTLVSGVEVAERCPNVCVYASGKLVGGTEPDGTKPAKVYTVAQLTRLMKHLTAQKPFEDAETAALFDFSGDGKLDAKDATCLKRLILAQ
ncbi:MAG: glycoside hydrolase family 9 protein [Oscillospiraceae bacterium]|nr:glycoside hydrolase family 9 protein [Oscillospiraceae bacterium]